MGRLCYPTQYRPGTCPDRPGNCPGTRRIWRNICSHGSEAIKQDECRGTQQLESSYLSRYEDLIKEKKSVRADKPLALFFKVAFRSPANIVTSNLLQLTVLALASYVNQRKSP